MDSTTKATPAHTPGPWILDQDWMDMGGCVGISGGDWAGFASVVVRMQDADTDSEVGLANARLIASAPALLAALRELLKAVDDLTNESGGVYGLHLNGDPAPWAELLPGGRFEDWLLPVDAARAAIAQAEGGEANG